MRFDPRLLDEIRARIRLSDVIGRTVDLRKQGREFAGLSPFNTEKTPSFFVNDDKRFYHCFSSGKHGDCFTWAMEMEGLSFPEAVERCASEAGVPLPEKDPRAVAAMRRAAAAEQWLEHAHAFFRAELRRARGAQARGYLERRGLPEADWDAFEIGFAPEDWSALKDFLVSKGAEPQQLLDAGLIARAQSGDRSFDYFRNRVTFAIRDAGGRLVGFGGRALDPNDRAKYLNSRESDSFHKGALLYRYPQARAAFARAEREGAGGLIVAEGYTDVIALARAGLEHAVAPLGTALTEEQLELLWRAGPEPVLCFDGDAAGLRAAYRAVDRALPKLKPGQSLNFTLLADGLDPDDLIRRDGASAMREALAGARPLVDILWKREFEAGPLDTPERKAGLKQRLFEAAGKIEDGSVAEQYRRELLSRFDAAFRRAPRTGRARRRDGTAPAMDDATAETRARAGRLMEFQRRARAGRLLAALLTRPSLVAQCAETLARLNFQESDHMKLRDALLDCAAESSDIDKSTVRVHLAKVGIEDTAARLIADQHYLAAPLLNAETPDGDAASAWERAAADFVRLTEADAASDRAALIARMKALRAAGDSAGLEKARRAMRALSDKDEPASSDAG